ncbi:uncharacterized protein LOC101863520 [Aplysia californica]|uniref:Uncharacterized protein LOC101863520 n=1 Tax=Aplysia californica TaxID=6500 RepID=A0ABM0JUW8_APLCA|nr:uncharacterized protein LOC101863520 [Aplysia californica]
MRLTLRPEFGLWLRQMLTPATGWRLVLQIVVASFAFLLILSLSTTASLRFSPFLYLKGDVCQVWKNAQYTTQGEFTWWQRACILERDWQRMEYICKDTRLMGNYPVCFDEPFSPIMKDKPCIVYSFGIANDFRFDDALARVNCTVYSFDPSMGVSDHLRGDRVHFMNLGIGAEDNDKFVPRVDGYASSTARWKIKKLSSIMKMLGHSVKSLSLLKMDVENNEWAILDNMLSEGLLEGLPQILVEWHIFSDSPAHSRFEKMYSDYNKFKTIGFRKFWMRNEGRNHWLPKMTTQAETAWVNTNYKIL